MMNFCIRSVNSLLGIGTAKNDGTDQSSSSCRQCGTRSIPTPSTGLILFSLGGDLDPPKNVIDHYKVMKMANSPPPLATEDDSGAFRLDFIDEIGRGVNGLTSCTESLGFESSDERRSNDQIEELNEDNEVCDLQTRLNLRKKIVKREDKKFPPPLPSLNRNGQRTSFLRPVRKDGRLELTEVRIQRKEVLRASRQDGRLRLHLIDGDDAPVGGNFDEVVETKFEADEEKDEEQEKKEGESQEEIFAKLRFPVASSGDGFRRCYDQMNNRHRHPVHHHHHHHHHLGWSPQHCVTIR